MVNSLLSWPIGGFKVSKGMTSFTLTRIRDVWANYETGEVEVYMSRQSLFTTQSHITPLPPFFSVLKKRWTDVTPSITKASMVSLSKSSGKPLITPWAHVKEDDTLQLTVLLPMFFYSQNFVKAIWCWRAYPEVSNSYDLWDHVTSCYSFSSSEIFLSSISHFLKLGPE